MATRFANPGERVLDDNGDPLSSGKLYFYTPVSGSTTAKAIYSDSALSTERANPVILPKSGLIPEIWLDGAYRLVIQDKNGVQQDAGDNVNLSSNLSTISVDDANNDTVSYPLTVQHETTGSPAVGIAVGIAAKVETASNNIETVGSLEFITTDVTAGSEDADFVVKLMAAGATIAEVLRVTSTGQLKPANDLIFTQADPEILGGDTDGTLIFGASTSNALGAILKLYGDTHATKAKDFEFLVDTTVVFSHDASAGVSLFSTAFDCATGSNIASASTVNLDTATGNFVHITGTTTITAVTLTRGPRTVIFDGILTLTHHATNNNLPSGANITTAAGDRAVYWSDGTTVYCTNYTRASGEAVVTTSAGWALLDTVTASGASTATVGSSSLFTTTYDEYVIVGSGLTFSADNNGFYARVSVSSTVQTTGYAYGMLYPNTGTSSSSYEYSDSATDIALHRGGVRAAAGSAVRLEMTVSKPADTAVHKILGWLTRGIGTSSSNDRAGFSSGSGHFNTNTSAIDGIQFRPISGTFSGTFYLFGIRKT